MRFVVVALASLLMVACASTEAEPGADNPEAGLADDDVGSFDDSKADLGSITWLRPAEPETFTLDEPHPASIDYSQCYTVDDPSVDLAIVCDPAISEVEWYRVDPADIEAALADGRDTLVVRFGQQFEDAPMLVRASIHRVGADGETSRLASRAQLFAGDQIDYTVDDASELYVYVGKGRILVGPWDTGTIDFVVTPSFEAAPPAADE
ncbi:MAG: hypothetical protein JRH11_12000 [Deltaproteobacteria bacterium]|nr:hypothetical protein [Deltaproteobacteria bacterium]